MRCEHCLSGLHTLGNAGLCTHATDLDVACPCTYDDVSSTDNPFWAWSPYVGRPIQFLTWIGSMTDEQVQAENEQRRHDGRPEIVPVYVSRAREFVATHPAPA